MNQRTNAYSQLATALIAWLLFLTASALAVVPSAGEMEAARAWCERVFSKASDAHDSAYLKLLYEDAADGITRGQSWRGTRFQLGERTYTHGLAFNATKHLLVHIGRPVQRFMADIGLENNDDTRRGESLGHGSVVFQVLLGDREIFHSPVLRRKDGPNRLDLDLHGAEEFEIRVSDAGDGRGWDQALWAEATIRTVDGTEMRLQDLPLGGNSNSNPFAFAFRYDGTNSASLLPHWDARTEDESPGATGFRRHLVRADPRTGLETRLEVTRFGDYPAVEWVAYLTNHGTTDTPIVEDLQAVDTSLAVPSSGDVSVHWARGAVASFEDFAPETTALKPNQSCQFVSGEGRCSSQVLPFFNVEGTGTGVIVALGWSGSWKAKLTRNARDEISIRAGQEHTHFVLHPGETVRTPRMLLLFYQGDAERGQNLLRQFILSHHRPTRSGQPLIAPITCGNWGGTRAEVHLDNIQKIIQNKLPIDYYWIDAEWFGRGGWPDNVGNWEVKTNLYPQGFKPISQALRSSDRELLLWFEPERVHKGTAWYRQHHDLLIDTGGDNCLFNLANPVARKFLTEFISQRIQEFGLGCYRQDFNMDPAPFWKAADGPDRQGITENQYIQGLYAFWDELLARHPGLIIDNCASGGRRIDLETIGRATPFWRTDGPRDPIAHQCHTYGLLSWVPLSATSEDRAADDYEFRSSMCSGLCLNWWVSGDAPAERIPDTFPFDWARKTLQAYLRFRDCYYGDYYPLTPYSRSGDAWMVYQLDQPKSGHGLVVALRRPASPYETARFNLHGLEAGRQYRLLNLDTGEKEVYSGADLAKNGLEIRLEKHRSSALFTYESDSAGSKVSPGN